ncbi:conserved hypothetical protein [Trichinella spiralis]|uniref:hypothetical protein n=1 Tax=Trichinella spiralis TaxID=6334 RepID=UPI0001EFEDDE|nr:conserved hypothetical protein [Trichinella spiralis]
MDQRPMGADYYFDNGFLWRSMTHPFSGIIPKEKKMKEGNPYIICSPTRRGADALHCSIRTERPADDGVADDSAEA